MTAWGKQQVRQKGLVPTVGRTPQGRHLLVSHRLCPIFCERTKNKPEIPSAQSCVVTIPVADSLQYFLSNLNLHRRDVVLEPVVGGEELLPALAPQYDFLTEAFQQPMRIPHVWQGTRGPRRRYSRRYHAFPVARGRSTGGVNRLSGRLLP